MALGVSKNVNNSFIYEPSSQSCLHSKTKTYRLAEEESYLVREPEIVADWLPTPHWTKTSAVLTHMLIIKDALNFTFTLLSMPQQNIFAINQVKKTGFQIKFKPFN